MPQPPVYLDENGEPISSAVYLDEQGNEIGGKPAKSLSGFLSNAASDLKAIPKTMWDAAQMLTRYSPMTVTGAQNTVGNLQALFNKRVPDDPMAQAGAAMGRNPGAVAGAMKDKIVNPGRTAGEIVDYAYDKPVQAVLDASAVLGAGGGALSAAGRLPRVAAGLSRASQLLDPVAGTIRAGGALARTAGAGGEVIGEATMRRALNMSDADVRARGGAERTALLNRVGAQNETKLQSLMAPIGERQNAAIDAMPEFVVSHERLPRLNALVDETDRVRGSYPARYDAAVRNRTEALTDPNFTSDRPTMDGMVPTEGRFPAPVAGRLLHENKQAVQQRAKATKAYIAHPDPGAEGDALAARAGDYRQILNDASPEYAAANAEFEPLMNLQEQMQQRALHRGGHDVPYAAGLGMQMVRGSLLPPVAGIMSSLALKNPRLASALAQGAFDVGQGMHAAGRGATAVAPQVNRLDALQRAILRQRASP